MDGVGVGPDDPATNPFASESIVQLAPLAGRPPAAGWSFRPLDATLGIPGLPQSATGQTTLFTGINAAARIGRHQVGIPGPSLRPILETESLFLKLVKAGRRPTLANAFPAGWIARPKARLGATTRMALAGGTRLRLFDPDEGQDVALPHDYTGEWSARHGVQCRRRDAGQAARVLASLAETNDVVVYEYFLTDLAGHRGTREERWRQSRLVEDLVAACTETLDPTRHRLIVVSDHGNLEESQHDRHTRNPAPLLVWGLGATELVLAVPGMPDLTPALAAGR